MKVEENLQKDEQKAEKLCKMHDSAQLVAELGRTWSRGTFKSLHEAHLEKLLADGRLKMVKQKGNYWGGYLPIFHDIEKGRILAWSGVLKKVVDLTKMMPKTIVPPACYATMLVAAKNQGPLPKGLAEIIRGDFDGDDLPLIADLLFYPGHLVGSTMISETVERSYPEAICEPSA